MKNPLLRLFFLPILVLSVALSFTACNKSTATGTPDTVPIVITDGTIINLTTTTAQSGGIITSNGGDVITANGVCYSTTNSVPTTANTKTSDALSDIQLGNVPFTSSLSALTPNTTYYLRAYAINALGVGYGNVVKFTTSSTISAITSVVSTFAGNGTAGYMDGSGTGAQFNNPQGISIDTKGNLYVSDSYNNYIREITPGGAVTTLAGNGTLGYVDGPAASAEFYDPMGSAFDAKGNLYIADYGNNVIRKISTAGVVSTFAGNGTQGFVDGALSSDTIEFNGPTALAFDPAGNLYISDRNNQSIRMITPAGHVSSLAGIPPLVYPTWGYYNGTDQTTAFYNPSGVVVDANNNVDVADANNGAIRKVTSPAGVTTTVAGGPAQIGLLNIPVALTIDKTGNLYIVDESGRILEYTTNNVIYVLAGSLNTAGLVNGAGATALFNNPQGIAIDASGNLYVADKSNNCIRKIAISVAQ